MREDPITLEQAKAMAEETGRQLWAIFAPDRNQYISDEHLEDYRGWMFFAHPDIKIPEEAWLRQSCIVISKYGEGRITANFYPDMEECAKYLRVMCDHFEEQGL